MMNEVAQGRERLRMSAMLIAWISIAVGLTATATLLYMMFLDTEPPFTNTEVATYDVHELPQTVFRPGDTMLVHRDLCFTRNVPMTMSRKLVRVENGSPLVIHLNETQGQRPPGCVHNANLLTIPANTPPGVYMFVNTVSYQNNPFQAGSAVLPSPRITVVK